MFDELMGSGLDSCFDAKLGYGADTDPRLSYARNLPFFTGFPAEVVLLIKEVMLPQHNGSEWKSDDWRLCLNIQGKTKWLEVAERP